MEEEMSFEQLQQLLDNPSYVLSEKQIQLLNKYRKQRREQHAKAVPKITLHKSSFKTVKNVPSIKTEKEQEYEA